MAHAAQRLDDGRLIAPANNNARYYYELALGNDPQNAAARQGVVLIAGKLVLQAREAMDAKRKMIAAAAGRFVSVTFTKKDGTERHMRIQPAALRYHLKGKEASPAARRAARARAQSHPNLLPVWDADARAVRSVNLATVSRIASGGIVQRFTS